MLAVRKDFSMKQEEMLWEEVFQKGLDFAFQPILDVSSGRVYGYEALLRNVKEAGFKSVFHLFDQAYENRSLYTLDLFLRRRALQSFVKLPDARKRRLFYNIDNRLLDMPDYRPGNTQRVLAEFDLAPSTMVFEISERHQFHSIDRLRDIIQTYRDQGFRIAIDDYGVGFSGLQLIYSLEPDIVKLDRFFIQGVDADPKRRIFLHHVIQLAHLMGGLVVAEGIETEEEYAACLKIGCDLVQGYYIGRPLFVHDPAIREVVPLRHRAQDTPRIPHLKPGLQIMRIEAVRPAMGFDEILSLFKRNPEYTLFPVVNEFDEPVGLLDESSLKSITYSQFGKDLFSHRDVSDFLRDHIRKCYVTDVHADADEMLKIFSLQDGMQSRDGILVTDRGRYAGFLSSAAMLRYIYQERIELAREENPLTGLPGNRSIMRFLEDAAHRIDPTTVVYLDLDHFKPFNDRYGFQKGDMALLAVGESLKRLAASDRNVFVGHVGGDDFFIGFHSTAMFSVLREVRRIREDFATASEGFLDPVDLERGWIEAANRYGAVQRFPLPGLSVAVLHFAAGRLPLHEFSRIVADAKTEAKGSRRGLLVRRIASFAGEPMDSV